MDTAERSVSAWEKHLADESRETREKKILYHFGGPFYNVDTTDGRDYYVIDRDGQLRHEDAVLYRERGKHVDYSKGEKRWDKIDEDEIALCWTASGSDRPQQMTVIKGIVGEPTTEQVSAIRALEVTHEVRQGVFGFDKRYEVTAERRFANIKLALRHSKVFQNMPPMLQDYILNKITSVEPFTSDEGEKIIDEEKLPFYVFYTEVAGQGCDDAKGERRIRELVGAIFTGWKTKLSDKVFNKQSATKQPVYFIDAVKIPEGVLEFFLYKYRGVQNINACLREYADGEEKVEALSELPDVPQMVVVEKKQPAQAAKQKMEPPAKQYIPQPVIPEKQREVKPLTDDLRQALQQELKEAELYVRYCYLFTQDATQKIADRKAVARLTGQIDKMQAQVDDLKNLLQEKKQDADAVDMNGRVKSIVAQGKKTAEDMSRMLGKRSNFRDDWQKNVEMSLDAVSTRITEFGEPITDKKREEIEKNNYIVGTAVRKNFVYPDYR
jgi:hypothetical protein